MELVVLRMVLIGALDALCSPSTSFYYFAKVIEHGGLRRAAARAIGIPQVAALSRHVVFARAPTSASRLVNRSTAGGSSLLRLGHESASSRRAAMAGRGRMPAIEAVGVLRVAEAPARPHQVELSCCAPLRTAASAQLLPRLLHALSKYPICWSSRRIAAWMSSTKGSTWAVRVPHAAEWRRMALVMRTIR